MHKHYLRRAFLFCLAATCLHTNLTHASDPAAWEESRTKYEKAMELLAQGKTSRFNKLKSQLKDYALYPYLDYAYLRQKMRRNTPSKSVAAFLNQYSDTPLAPVLKHRWLRTLARRGQWQRYLEFYDDQIRSTELKCHALWAEHKSGKTQTALVKVQPLWLIGKSQPKACDPIFKLWREADNLNDDLVWQRFSLAMKARNTQLARYLIRYMSPDQQKLAKLYRELHFYPDRLQRKNLKIASAKNEEILLHSIRRLAGKDALLAKTLWKDLSIKHGFSGPIKQQIDHRIILKLAKQNHGAAYLDAISNYPYPDDTALIEAGIDLAIRDQDWPSAINRILRLPEPTRNLARWQYWLARAAQQNNPEGEINSSEIYSMLADKRNYYGFLSADFLNTAYQLTEKTYPIEGEQLEQLELLPGIIRARELFLTGNTTDARREWNWVSREFSEEQHYAAAHYAQQLGWHSQAIRSAIRSERWHDLKLRFPLAYHEEITTAAKTHHLSSNWLLALARQESAMTSDAQSPKGAMGLMQVMPNTAKAVSRKYKIRYRSRYDLLKPKKNIELASAYFKGLLKQFNDNKVYAIAAYNAGPHRVNRWLKKTAHLPLDIWIENIPFSETRQYVKNVLAFSVIFARLQQQDDFQMATREYLANYSPKFAAKSHESE